MFRRIQRLKTIISRNLLPCSETQPHTVIIFRRTIFFNWHQSGTPIIQSETSSICPIRENQWREATREFDSKLLLHTRHDITAASTCSDITRGDVIRRWRENLICLRQSKALRGTIKMVALDCGQNKGRRWGTWIYSCRTGQILHYFWDWFNNSMSLNPNLLKCTFHIVVFLNIYLRRRI